MNVIELNNINLSFNKQVIFDDASLAISTPGFYCLVGRNGTGKTTLFNILTNKVKINSGKIITNRDDISYCDANSLLFTHLTVRENLYLITSDNDKIINLLNKFQIEKLLDVYPKHLSEGERQRVAIARTILEDKQIILLDEVTSHIDDKNAQIVLNYLKELSRDHIIIYATHFKKEVNFYADSIIKIENHKMILSNSLKKERTLISNNTNNYVPFKILHRIIRFKPDYLFAIIFTILTAFTLSSIWLSGITKTNALLSVEKNSINNKYAIIDDYSMNIYDYFSDGSINTGTDVDDRVVEFVSMNPKFKLGKKNYQPNTGMNDICVIEYLIFDNSLEDYEIACSKETYDYLCNDLNMASDYKLKFRCDTFKIKLLDATTQFDLFAVNEYTYKVLSKFQFNYNVATINEVSVHLTSRRIPENDDEIIKLEMVYGEDTYNVVFGDQEKTYNIVGTFDYVVDSIYDKTPWYLVYDEHAFDFKLNASDALSTISGGYIAYGDARDLTEDDINFILSNDLYVINDVMEYAYNSYNYIDNLRDNFIRVLIFVLTLDAVTIVYYISYWLHSNKDRYDELKRLNKIKYIKKRCILTRCIISLIIFSLGIGLFLIAQSFMNQAFVENCFQTADLSIYNFSFINNYFLMYAIPLLIIIELLVSGIQVRRSIYD